MSGDESLSILTRVLDRLPDSPLRDSLTEVKRLVQAERVPSPAATEILVSALQRIADPRNIHFAGDAQVVAAEALEKLHLTAHPALKALKDFDRYFTSLNGIDVEPRVSVPRDEWRALRDSISAALTTYRQVGHRPSDRTLRSLK